jgi:exo-beta-1,3-glucanase (GH17 family)
VALSAIVVFSIVSRLMVDKTRSSIIKLPRMAKRLRAGLGLLVLVSLYLMAQRDPVQGEPVAIVNRPTPISSHVFSLNLEDLSTHESGLPVPWAVSYSPLTWSGVCKPVNNIKRDLQEIQRIGINTVRIFSDDCRILQCLEDTDLHIILGIQPYSRETNFRRSINSQLAEISKWGYWDRIDMLVVGSQGVSSDVYTRADLVKMIKYVRMHVQHQPGFRAIITTAEPVESWVSATKFNAASRAEYKEFRLRQDQMHSPIEGVDDLTEYDVEDNDLCAVVDAIGLVVEPYFNSAVDSTTVGALVSRDVRFAKYLCSDDFIGSAHAKKKQREHESSHSIGGSSKLKVPPVVVLEAGWPSSGQTNGHAYASVEHQTSAVEELINSKDIDTNERVPVVIYSYQDELWRDPGELSVERSFGISQLYLEYDA